MDPRGAKKGAYANMGVPSGGERSVSGGLSF